MPQWFQSKIGYRVQDVTGKWKTISESFLHDGVSFTDVEAQIFKMVEGRVTDFEIKAITLVKFESVYEPFIAKDGKLSDFYKVTVLQVDVDEKKTTTFHLVAGFDVTDAEKWAEQYMSGWIGHAPTIVSVTKSPILGVWHPVAEDWQNDFKQRMEKLAEDGNESVDHNQTQLFDRDGNPKTYEQERDDLADEVLDAVN